MRGRGLLRGIDYKGGEVKDLLARLQERGMLALRAGTNILRIAPPLVMEKKELMKGISMIEEAL